MLPPQDRLRVDCEKMYSNCTDMLASCTTLLVCVIVTVFCVQIWFAGGQKAVTTGFSQCELVYMQARVTPLILGTETTNSSGGGVAPAAGGGTWQVWRLLTSLFIHGGLIYMLTNTLLLLCMGLLLEKLSGMGGTGTLFAFAMGGLNGNLLSTICMPGSMSCGASPGCLGVFGALNARALMEEPSFVKDKRAVVALSLACTVAEFTLEGLGILPYADYVAHIGGMVTGLLVGSMPAVQAIGTACAVTAFLSIVMCTSTRDYVQTQNYTIPPCLTN